MVFCGLQKILLECEAGHSPKCSEELKNKCVKLSRGITWAGHVARIGISGIYSGIRWETRRKETTRRFKHRWEDNIKMDIRDNGWDGMDRINLAQDRDQWRALVNAVMNLRV
jgi:hypothetical protein